MLYEEFLKGTGGIDCEQNYNEFCKMEAVYAFIDGMTKEDVYKQANVIKTNNTTLQVNFLAELFRLKKKYQSIMKNEGETYWFFRDADLELDKIMQAVAEDPTLEAYIDNYTLTPQHPELLSSKTYEAIDAARTAAKELAQRLGIV